MQRMELNVPRLPNAAFEATLARVGTFLDTAPLTTTGGITQDAADAFCRGIGLDGEGDVRARGLSNSVNAALRGIPMNQLGPDSEAAGVIGITLGLMLALATGWDPAGATPSGEAG
jgi:hypothetical protein